jgi:hypothetical protein
VSKGIISVNKEDLTPTLSYSQSVGEMSSQEQMFLLMSKLCLFPQKRITLDDLGE